ncbi:hypothetical protein GCM10022226_71080 [Sphaerisporangium flaviroseum]|uniref:Histidine kinase/HSP90-like ATPase domain-containing protein n=1 Tax=Sphaerisporangium flaviroseum TaxID=509199 RepID=A0ABP7J9J7_9ACTN
MNAATGAEERQRSSWCDLPGSRLAPSIARRWVSAILGYWNIRLSPSHEATIAELTSELVTNAVQHAAPTACDGHGIRINVRAERGTVWLAVCDPDPTLPTRRTLDQLTESGRGLFLVAAQADQWGAVQCEGGKYVWFSVECHGGAQCMDAASSPGVPLGFTSGVMNPKENPPCPPSFFPTTSTAPGRIV